MHDPSEANPPLLGDVELVDVETESARKVTVTEKNLRTYRKLFEEYHQAVLRYCRSYGMGCTQTNTTVRFDDLILRMMRTAGAVQ
jgi:protein tyrosine phosphatase (PTP) superfamily phosphohydrolase (DUF442 family)